MEAVISARARSWGRVGLAAVAALVLLPLLAGPVGAQSDGADQGAGVVVSRLGAADRYATSLAIAEAVAAEAGGSLDRVVIVSGERWHDAVVAAPLASLGDGALAPILLSHPSKGLTASAVRFIERVGAEHASVVSTDTAEAEAVPVTVDSGLRALGLDVERFGGADAYGTSVAVADSVVTALGGDLDSLGGDGGGGTVFVASGEAFADALVAGPLAGSTQGALPLLLTPKSGLDEAVRGWLARHKPAKAVVMGGTAAVSAQAEAQIRAAGVRTVERIAGRDRFDTAAKAAAWAAQHFTGGCYGGAEAGLARADVPFDSFSAGPLLAARCAPLLLTTPGEIPAATAAALGAMRDRQAPTGELRLNVFGGESAVSTAAIDNWAAVANGTENAVAPLHDRLPTTWLARVNAYRAASGLSLVTEQPAWSVGIMKHLEYLRRTPVSLQLPNRHHQASRSPYYTEDGAVAGRSSNLGFGRNDAAAIDGWMAAPFHAVGILRPGLERVAFARSVQFRHVDDGRLVLNAGLDDARGLSRPGPVSRDAVLFPGPGSEVPLSTFRGENPSPLEACPGYVAGASGLPLIIMLPDRPSASATAQLIGPSGARHSTDDGSLCRVDEHTYDPADTVYGPAGQSILRSDNAVFLIADEPLAAGPWQAEYTAGGSDTLRWSFTVYEPADNLYQPDESSYPSNLTVDIEPEAASINLRIEAITPHGLKPDQINSSQMRYRMTWDPHPEAVEYLVVGFPGSKFTATETGGPTVTQAEYRVDGWTDQLAFGTTYSIIIVACTESSIQCLPHGGFTQWTTPTAAEFEDQFWPARSTGASGAHSTWDANASNTVTNLRATTALGFARDVGLHPRITLAWDPVPGAIVYFLDNPWHDPSLTYDWQDPASSVFDHDRSRSGLSGRTNHVSTWLHSEPGDTVTFSNVTACGPFPGTSFDEHGWPERLQCGDHVDIDVVIPAA